MNPDITAAFKTFPFKAPSKRLEEISEVGADLIQLLNTLQRHEKCM
jgi:hypothetical protein